MNEQNPLHIDRLLELGLELNIAQRMVTNMNAALQSAWTPGAAPPAPGRFVLALDGQPAGPFSEAELSALIGARRLVATTLTWRSGMPGWRPAREVPELGRLLAICSPLSNDGA